MEEVLNYIKQNKNVTKKKLIKNLSLSENEINEIIISLLNDLKIELKDNYYEITEKNNRKVGTLSLKNKGFGFVNIGDKDIYISKRNLNGAMDGNLVLIDIFKDEQNRDCGVVVKRKVSMKKLVGTIIKKDNEITISFDNPKYQAFHITIPNISKYDIDSKVLVETDGKTGKIIEVLGYKDSPGMDILSIVKEMEIRDTFPNEVLDELQSIPLEITEDDNISNRRDLREDIIFTIDGEDAKDFDDAVGIKKLENGNYELTVSIADVSHYVKEGSELDKEAKLRGCSVYLTDRVIPMLPKKLSNEICSLKEGVNRLTITTKMIFDTNGNLKDYDIFESVICSKKRMKYHEVNDVLNGNVVEGYEPFIKDLKTMQELSHILRDKRKEIGGLSFETNEIKIIVDETGKAIDVKEDVRGEAEKLIEDFMIANNEVVATYVSYMGIPFIYRIHDLPDIDKLKLSKTIIQTMGYKLRSKNGKISNKAIQEFLNEVKDTEEYDIIADILLRSMKKAVYSTYNEGHYALASKNYSHFTSPIRRYPDLVDHRVVKKIMKNEIDYDKLNELSNILHDTALLSSKCEQKAEECEHEVDKMKSAEYLEDKQGYEFEGKIFSIDERGMYVKLKNQIEGFVSPKDFAFGYDYDNLYYRNTENDQIYKLGTKVKVKVIKTDKMARTIDFEIE